MSMTTYINQIVQTTRQIATTDTKIATARATAGTATLATLNTRHNDLTEQRINLTVQALQAGVAADLIQWAVGMNDTAAKIQMQKAMAHMVAAVAQAT